MTRYIEGLNENTAPVAGDYLLCYDASADSTDKDRKVNVSKFAVLAVANTFTATQNFVPAATGDHAISVNVPTSTTGDTLRMLYNNTLRARISILSNDTLLSLPSFNNGSSFGCRFYLGRNSNGSTPSGGIILMEASNGTFYPLFFDTSGNLRTDTAGNVQPTSVTSGTVVGTQSSSLDSKDVLEEFTDYDGALAAILAAPLYDFTYKNGRFGGQKFTGIITDYSPTFGMDRDDAHPAGKSLNEVTAFGYTAAAFKALTRRIEELERRAA